MADKKNEDKKAETKAETKVEKTKDTNAAKYYKCENHAGLAVCVDGEVVATFTPYFEVYRGDTIRVGYLETDIQAVQTILAGDYNVEEIQADEYDKATGPKSHKAPQLSV